MFVHSLAGDKVEFLPKVPRRGNADGPGGREGSSTSHRLAIIGMFYVVEMVGGGDHLPSQMCVVSVLVLPHVQQQGKLRVVPISLPHALSGDVHLKGWNFSHQPDVHALIHVDSITARVMLVPHHDKAFRDSQMCVLPVWKSR